MTFLQKAMHSLPDGTQLTKASEAAYAAALKAMFLLPPERIHGIINAGLRALHVASPVNRLAERVVRVHDSALEQECFGVRFPAPLGLAELIKVSGQFDGGVGQNPASRCLRVVSQAALNLGQFTGRVGDDHPVGQGEQEGGGVAIGVQPGVVGRIKVHLVQIKVHHLHQTPVDVQPVLGAPDVLCLDVAIVGEGSQRGCPHLVSSQRTPPQRVQIGVGRGVIQA